MVKQRKESLKAFQDAKREDLAVIEEKEIEFLSKYLPEPLSEDELNRAIHEAIQKLGATTPADMGKVMTELKVSIGGRGYMSQASKTVREILSKSS